MAKEKIIHHCARLAGILLVGFTVPHSTFGLAEVLTAIKLGDVRGSMADTFHVIWILSTIMILLTGVWALFIASDLRQLSRKAWWQGVLLGLGYTAGGLACIFIAGFYAHLMALTLIGLLLLLPLIIGAGSFWKKTRKSTLHT